MFDARMSSWGRRKRISKRAWFDRKWTRLKQIRIWEPLDFTISCNSHKISQTPISCTPLSLKPSNTKVNKFEPNVIFLKPSHVQLLSYNKTCPFFQNFTSILCTGELIVGTGFPCYLLGLHYKSRTTNTKTSVLGLIW